MKLRTAKQLQKQMNISEALAESVVAQFAKWKKKFDPIGSKPAITAYQGDVYIGLEASTLSSSDLQFAQSSIRILSGLYGMLRPCDLIQPYRLEMGLNVATDRGKSLYDYWGDRITKAIAKQLSAAKNRVIVNLASTEYSRAIDFDSLNATVINPSFKEVKDGKARFLSFFGKKARGMMARYLIDHQVDSADAVLKFDSNGYRWNRELSTPAKPVFTRKQRAGFAN